MMIRSMQATFGKLDGASISFHSGLNVLEAPNEWGKSTWSAFLLAMFYGVDTKSRTTKNSLSDKEHYMPWSGKPMEGRIELEFNGRNITIVRTTKGRVPMGSFRAFETDTGIDIPELKSDNCGELLLGVPLSVFRRTGFIRMADMTVTEDDTLRSRLNNLVTTGDDSGDAARLEAGLRSLKNKLSNHNNGLILQTEEQEKALKSNLQEFETLGKRLEDLQKRREDLQATYDALINHKKTLENERARKNAEAVQAAFESLSAEEGRVKKLSAVCEDYPDREAAQSVIDSVRELEDERRSLQSGLEKAGPDFQSGVAYAGLLPGEAARQAKKDADAYQKALRPGWAFGILLSLALFCLGGFAYYQFHSLVFAISAGVCGFIGLITALFVLSMNRNRCKKLEMKYGSANPHKWIITSEKLDAMWMQYCNDLNAYKSSSEAARKKLQALEMQKEALLQGKEIDFYYHAVSYAEQLADAILDLKKARIHYQTLSSMSRAVSWDVKEDLLNLSEDETERGIKRVSEDIQQVRQGAQLVEYQRSLLGTREKLLSELEICESRLHSLRSMEKATQIALQAHHQAQEELHRRFSPEITKLAQQYLQSLTMGRYHKILLNQDFDVSAGGQDEIGLRDVKYRSDGTMDQIYLSLRLAVSELLAPDAPLILDDAFARFDDERLKNALELLKEIGQTKQIILFTCQHRETQMQ